MDASLSTINTIGFGFPLLQATGAHAEEEGANEVESDLEDGLRSLVLVRIVNMLVPVSDVVHDGLVAGVGRKKHTLAEAASVK